MIGYKAFDQNFMCRGFQYEVGKTYEFDGELEICKSGFHFCENITDCFYYYSGEGRHARFARVEALGTVIKSDRDSKCVTNKIRIIEEIPLDDAIKMTNTGDWNIGFRNTGDFNTGNCNTGDRNTGYWNSGKRNAGDRNVGDWNVGSCNTGDRNVGDHNAGRWNTGNCNVGDGNSGDCNVGDKNVGDWNTGCRNSGNLNTGDWNKSSSNTGCFMTANNTIMMFNKPSSWTLDDWRSSLACIVMNSCPIDCTDIKWIVPSDMTDKEKEEHPDYETKGGYLKTKVYKADKQKWWDGLSVSHRQAVINLPNFDADIFYECTGIRVYYS